MIKQILFAFTILFSLNTQGQISKIDSLHKLIQEHPHDDTFKVNRMLNLYVVDTSSPNKKVKLQKRIRKLSLIYPLSRFHGESKHH